MAIAGRAIASLFHSKERGDLYRLYFVAQRDGVDCNLALIPHTFDAPHAEEFDTAYMRQLYELAGTMAAGGYPSEKELANYRALAEQSRTPPRGAMPTS